mmetsp:Transcript_81957/g.228428  ORF Transcript_81957/g.228428 Transcript_81957/m.228428 type:complete len:140 (-) Transcript_81957:166-585(-)
MEPAASANALNKAPEVVGPIVCNQAGATFHAGPDLLSSALRGDVDTCRTLLTNRPELLEFKDASGRTALLHAAREGHVEVCAVLLKAGADVEATDRDNMTPLSYAARKRHSEICQLLLHYGADIEATDCIVRDVGCALL